MYRSEITARATPKGSEILIYGDIGAPDCNATTFARALQTAGSSPITLRINSPGGNAADGFAIYNAIDRHAAKVTAVVDGIAASAASLIAMAADHIVMSENAVMMIHEPSAATIGTSDDHRKSAEMIDTFRVGMLSAYEKRTKADRNWIARLMKEETWMSAAAALVGGFCDEIGNPTVVTAKFDLSKYRHPPLASTTTREQAAAGWDRAFNGVSGPAIAKNSMARMLKSMNMTTRD